MADIFKSIADNDNDFVKSAHWVPLCGEDIAPAKQ